MQLCPTTAGDPAIPAPKPRTLIRRASGMLSTLSVPFTHHRNSLSLDSSGEPDQRRLSNASGWPNWDDLDDVSAPRMEIIVNTAMTVHRSSEDTPRDAGRPSLALHIAPAQLTRQPSAQSYLKPHAYHYQKARAADDSSALAYTPASRRLRTESRSMEHLGFHPAQLPDAHVFQAALAGAFAPRPSFDQPDSPESETSETGMFSPLPSSQSSQLHVCSSAMERRIETTSSIGYVGRHLDTGSYLASPVAEATDNERNVSGDDSEARVEDYSSWIKFESPLELLSPALSSSPSTASACSLRTPADLPSASVPLVSQESCSSDSRFCPPQEQPPAPANKLHRPSHYSLRKKISQSFKETFNISKIIS